MVGKAFKAEEGRIKILGSFNAIMYEAEAFACTVQIMSETMGARKTYAIFREAGKIAVANMIKTLGLQPKPQIFMKFLPLSEFYGWGKFEIRKFQIENKINIEFAIVNSPIVEYALKRYGRNSKVCNFYRGIVSGFLSVVFKKELDVQEERCMCNGFPHCPFRVMSD